MLYRGLFLFFSRINKICHLHINACEKFSKQVLWVLTHPLNGDFSWYQSRVPTRSKFRLIPCLSNVYLSSTVLYATWILDTKREVKGELRSNFHNLLLQLTYLYSDAPSCVFRCSRKCEFHNWQKSIIRVCILWPHGTICIFCLTE